MRLEGQATMLRKRQTNAKTAATTGPPKSSSSSDQFLPPFPTVPPVLNGTDSTNSTISSSNSSLENSVSESNNGVSGVEMLGLAGGALVVVGLIGLFIRKKIIGDNRTRDINDTERNNTRSSYMKKSHFSRQYNEDDEKYSPSMVDRNEYNSSRKAYDSPPLPPSLKKNFYSSQNENSSSRNLLSSSPTTPQSPFTPNPQQRDPSYPSYPSYPADSHIVPSPDDDSSYVLQQQSTSNYQQSYQPDLYGGSSQDDHPSPFTPKLQEKELPYPPNSYGGPLHGGPSQDDHILPYSSQSPYAPNPQQREPPYPPNSYGGPSQDDHPLPQPPLTPNLQQRGPINSFQDDYNAYGQDDYNPSPYLLQSPNSQQIEQSYQQNSYREPPYENSQQQYPRDSIHFQQTQGTLLSSNSYQLQQSYRTPPHTPLDPPYSPFLSKSELVPTNDQDSSSSIYQDNLNTPIVPLVVNNVSHEIVGEIDDNNSNSDIIKNDLKDIEEMIANAMPSKNLSYVSHNSLTNLLDDIPITSTNEKSNLPISQTSSVYSARDTQMEYVQPTQQIEMASENKVMSSNPSHDLSQLMQPAAMGFIEPTQSNMVIENVTEPSNVATQVSPKPLYDLDGIKKHAEKVLNKKVEKKEVDLDNKSDSERMTKSNDNENVTNKNDENQGEPLVRKKSVRFRTEASNQKETQKASNPKKSILINKDDARNIQNAVQPSSTLESEDFEDEKANNRRSNIESYQVYDFDVTSYQDDT